MGRARFSSRWDTSGTLEHNWGVLSSNMNRPTTTSASGTATASGWLAISQAHARQGRWQQALEVASQGMRDTGGSGPAQVTWYAHCLLRTGSRVEAFEVAEGIDADCITDAATLDSLGSLFVYGEQVARAQPLFEQAVELDPNNIQFLYNLAAAYRMLGQLQGAEGILGRVIRLNPNDVGAHHMRSELRRQTPESNHVAQLGALLQRTALQSMDEIAVRFALAKEYDDLEDYSLAFQHLKSGCDRYRGLIRYDAAADLAFIEALMGAHGPPAGPITSGLADEDPIFVFGLPRSGTTLVERILASHSRVRGAGELTAFATELVRAVTQQAGGRVAAGEFVSRAYGVNFESLGTQYLRVARVGHASSLRFVDKQPMNFLNAGLISRTFPPAPLIALARDPMDSCFAMYRTLFVNSYPYSYNLEELAAYYAAWHRLMRHWQAVLGEQLLVVQYEELVQAQERVSRRIIEHCGLEWEEGCLQFHTSTAAVSTASAVQVRRPIYSSSVGKWRHYEEQLQPLRQALERLRPATGWELTASD
jgi:tetratricopeptide (TPR) repeat protein